MISDFLIDDIANYIRDRIISAEVIYDDTRTVQVEIMRKQIDKNTLKVFVNTSNGTGNIVDIRLLDAEGKVLISKPKGIIKTIDHAIISTFWIKILEEEVDDPINIFEIKGGLNG